MDGTMNALRAEAQLASMNDQIQQLEARLSAKTAHCDDLEKRNKEFDTKMRSVREEAHNVCNQWKENAAKNKDRLTSSETARRLVEEKLVESDRIAIELKKFIDSNAKEQQGSVELLRQDKARLQEQLTLEIKKADDADRERSTMCFKFDGLQRSYLELQERLSTQTTLASTKDDTIHQLNQNIEQREQLLKNVQASLEQATAAAGNWERDCIAAVEIAEDLRVEIKKEAKDVETQFKNCQVVKEQLTTAERALEAKAGAHADAEAKITRLQTDIESFKTAKTTASEKATQLEDELSVLGLELKALESEKKDLTTKRTHDQAALKQLQGDYTALEQDKENTVSSLQAEISTLQGTISDLQEQTTHQNSSLGALETNLASATESLKSTQEQLASVQAVLQDTTTKMSAATAANTDLGQQLSESKTLTATLTKRLEEEMAEHTASAESLSAEISELQTRVTDTEKAMATKTTELEAALREKENQIMQNLTMLNELQLSVTNTKEELSKTTQRHDESLLAKEKIAGELLAEQHRALTLSSDLDILRAHVKTNETTTLETHARMEAEVRSLQETNNKMEEEMLAQSSEFAKLQMAKDDADAENSKMSEASKAQAEALLASESALADLHVDHVKLNNAKVAMEGELTKTETLLSKTQEQRDTEAVQSEQLNAEKKDLQEKLADAETQLLATEESLASERRVLVDVKEEREAVKDDLNRLLETATQTKNEASSTISSLNAEITVLQEQLTQSQNQTQRLETEGRKMASAHEQLQRKFHEMESKFSEASRQNEDYQQQYSDEVEKSAQLDTRVAQLTEKLTQKDRQIHDLRTKEGDADNMLTQNKDERRALKERVAELEDTAQLRSQDLATINTAHKTLSDDLALEQAKREKLKGMFNELGEKLKTSQKEHQLAEDRVTEVANKHDSVCINFKKVHQKYMTAKEQLKTLQAADPNATANATMMNATTMLAQSTVPIGGTRSAEDAETIKRQDAKIHQQLDTLKTQQGKIDSLSTTLTKLVLKGKAHCDRYGDRCKEMAVLQESVRVLTNRLLPVGKTNNGAENQQHNSSTDAVTSMPLNTNEGARRVPKRVNSTHEGEGAPPNKAPRRAMHNTPHNQTF